MVFSVGDLEACADLSSASCEFRADGYGGVGHAIGGSGPSSVGDRAVMGLFWEGGWGVFCFHFLGVSLGFALSVCDDTFNGGSPLAWQRRVVLDMASGRGGAIYTLPGHLCQPL